MAEEIFQVSKVYYSPNKETLLLNIFNKVNDIVYTINTKDTGIYNNEEFFTCQQWYVDRGQNQKSILWRKAYNIGALPNSATINIAHGLPLTTDWDFIKIYGTAKDPIAIQSIPLSNPNISIMISTVNINITTTANLSAYTNTKIILEYIKP